MYSEDAYCLGLLYAHIYADKKMVLKDDLDKFHKIIEFNLRSMNKDINDTYATVWYDNDPSIYFVSEGKNGEIYYVLYPDFDLNRAKSKYIGCLSTDVLVASQKENALNSIDLKTENGKIVKKKINELQIPTYDFLKDCRSCQNMNCRVENCEKLVNNCIGYIHHDEKQEQPKNMALTKKRK